jgi:hypothetical protein
MNAQVASLIRRKDTLGHLDDLDYSLKRFIFAKAVEQSDRNGSLQTSGLVSKAGTGMEVD